MRSFSQHQNRVVLLLVGATPLAQRRDPDWARHFVHPGFRAYPQGRSRIPLRSIRATAATLRIL